MIFSPVQGLATTPFEWRIAYRGTVVGVVPFTTEYIVTTADLEFATNLLNDFLFDFLNTNPFSREPILIELVQLDCDRRISQDLDPALDSLSYIQIFCEYMVRCLTGERPLDVSNRSPLGSLLQALDQSLPGSSRYVASRNFLVGYEPNQGGRQPATEITLVFSEPELKDPPEWIWKEELEKLGYSDFQKVKTLRGSEMWGIPPRAFMPVPIKRPDLLLYFARLEKRDSDD